MADYDEDVAADLILAGHAPDKAIAAARESGLEHLIEMVLPIGGISSTPDPQCVARQLEGIEHPTREDVIGALRACTPR